MEKVTPYAKALVAFLVPGVVALVAAVSDGSDNGSSITGPEWVGIAAACLLTAAGVYATPNKDPRGLRQDESVQPPRHRGDLGQTNGFYLLGAVLVVLGVVLVLVDVLTVGAGYFVVGIVLALVGIGLVIFARR